MSINYKYNEKEIMEEAQKYIDTTYSSSDNSHYAQGNIETAEFIIDNGHGTGYLLGNVMKYASRYGKKEGFNRKDLLKIVHYAIMALHVDDLRRLDEENQEKRTRITDILKSSESERSIVSGGVITGSYYQEGRLRDVEYNVQHDSPKSDIRGLSGEERVYPEKEERE